MSESHHGRGHRWTPPQLPVDPDAPVPRPRHVLHPRQWDVLLAIAVGGGLGSLGRWGLSRALPPRPGSVPWATLLENVTGALLIGALMVFVVDVWRPHRYARPFLGVGVLGGYTTFSTYALETRDLLAGGHVAVALGYVVGSVLLGLAAVGAGVRLARVVAVGRHRHRTAGADR